METKTFFLHPLEFQSKMWNKLKDFFIAILLLSEIAVIKIEAHTKRAEPECQGNALDDFHAKIAATESTKIAACVDEVHSASAKKKNGPSLPDFCCPDVLVTWKQSATESEKLRWVNNGCNSITSWDCGKLKTATWFVPASWKMPFFCFCLLSSAIVHLGWLKLWTDVGGEMSIKLGKQFTSNIWPVRSITLEKLFLSPDLLPLDPLSTCSWTSFNCRPGWVINKFLPLYVCFPDGLKPSLAARLMPSR